MSHVEQRKAELAKAVADAFQTLGENAKQFDLENFIVCKTDCSYKTAKRLISEHNSKGA